MLTQKTACPQGGESTSGVGAFQKGGKPRRDRNFQEPVGPWPLLKISMRWKRTESPEGAKGDDPRKTTRPFTAFR